LARVLTPRWPRAGRRAAAGTSPPGVALQLKILAIRHQLPIYQRIVKRLGNSNGRNEFADGASARPRQGGRIPNSTTCITITNDWQRDRDVAAGLSIGARRTFGKDKRRGGATRGRGG